MIAVVNYEYVVKPFCPLHGCVGLNWRDIYESTDTTLEE